MLLRLGAVFAALASTVTPIEKVAQLLKDLATKIEEEAKKEEETYLRFERFCREESATKEDAIANGKAKKADLEGNLESMKSRRMDANQRAEDAQTNLTDLARELREEKASHAENHKAYKASALDLSEAITAVRNAVDSLEASFRQQENAGGGTGNNFLQQPQTLEIIRKALLMSDALGLSTKTRTAPVVAFLDSQDQPENNRRDFEFHSDQIISVLKDLQKDLVDEKAAKDKQWASDKDQHNFAVLRNNQDREEQERQLAKEQALVAKLTGDIGSTNRDLADTEAKLKDDEGYLADLTKNCDDKARTWDQRVAMREDELTALRSATDIIESSVAERVTDQTVRLIQTHVQHKNLMQTESFLQTEKIMHHKKKPSKKAAFLQPADKRERVAYLLRNAGTRFHSAAFATIASQVLGSGPFKKIIGLIQALVERLQEEAQTDQDHNNWCNKQTKLATQQRNIRSAEVAQFNQNLESGEARRDNLKQTIATLSGEISDLEAAYAEASEEREKEKLEHQQAVADADNGIGALKAAEELLRRFYEDRGAKGKVELVNTKGDEYPDAPDAGFKNFEAYKGKQGASVGVLSMIEVLQSDFQRTIDETNAQEQAAKIAFTDMFEGENQTSQDEKNKLRDIAKNNLTETQQKLGENLDALNESQNLLDKSVEELQDLNEACVKTEMTYEERVARREDEISSLKEALCILDNEGPVKTGEC